MARKHFIDEDDDKDYTPVVRRELKVEPPALKRITQNSTEEDLIEADLDVAHTVLESLNQTWKWVGTINEAIRLANATMGVLGKRRVLANKKLGAPKDEGFGGGVLDITD